MNHQTAAEANDTAHPEQTDLLDTHASAPHEDAQTPPDVSGEDPAPVTAEAPAADAVATEATPAEAPAAEAPAAEAMAAEAPAETAPVIEIVAEAPALPLFSELGLSEPILRALVEKGYAHPTPIQAQAIPAVLAGRDVMGVAQTGTGKTAGFTLPMLDILSGSRARARMPRSLILEPTRELALQVAENFVAYGKYLKLTHALLIGGESLNDQKDVLMKGVDVLIATPGRLIDLFERGGLMLTDTKLLVIDEADRMLDMGFIPDVERIVAMLPKNRQTMFFSATMAPEIRRLSDAFLDNPKLITVSRAASVATTIVTGLALVAEIDKREALRRLIRSEDVQNALIFCNRKRDVDILHKSLTKHGFSVGALHGDMSQPARFATLEKFKQNELRLLVCSDVAARGIDIGGLSHVFNFDVPHHAEDYVHRIGRTGRAGKTGHAFTLATPEDKLAVEAIEKLTGTIIPPFVVDGLDVVEWAEGDGRRRGRGGKGRGSAAPARRGKPAEAEPAEGAAEKPRSERSGRPPRSSEPRAPEARASEARAPEARRPARNDERRPARPDSNRPERDRAPERAPAPEYREARPDRGGRDFRRRDEDLGPAVQGFGDEIPAFMLLPWRRDRVRPAEADSEA